ncbi:MAG: cation:proton antiporter [Phocaeicola sp.]
MSTLPPLISDLALIMVSAGAMTLLFKYLKQPLVLGYIVAGLIASPHFSFTPSVIDLDSVHTWSEIGVVFLLFALGLEFSFKKIVKVGRTAVIAACTIITGMISVGMFVGWSFGWERMDCLFLGGMLAMSSTTIIYKAFDDLGLRQKRFAGLVLSILILEDILAIVLMVVLSTLAVSQNFEGVEMMISIAKLIFFLIIWFVVGLYLIPIFLKYSRKWMGNETLLIVSIAFCFGMVVLAEMAGFSPAFGAFIMGSILAETIEAERIEKIITPVKDLFGAVFFVSVGMMIDPGLIVENLGAILAITAAILLGQALFSTGGIILAGQPLKVAMQSSFSLMQIGEFAFIIAGLGVGLNVTSSFLYPTVVAVSVLTTFLTPYMIRLSDPIYNFLEKSMSLRWKRVLDGYASGVEVVDSDNNWRKLLLALARITLINSVVAIGIIALSFHFLNPFLQKWFPPFWAELLCATLTIALISPFLRAFVMKKNRSVEFQNLWGNSRLNRAPLVLTIIIRFLLAVGFVLFIFDQLFHVFTAWIVGGSFLISAIIMFSRWLKKQSILLERTFIKNLHLRETHAEHMGRKAPKYAGSLLSRDLHLTDFEISVDSLWAGKTLYELNFSKEFDIHVVSILRGNHRINTPGGSVCIFPYDKLQVIGTDEQLSCFAEEGEKVARSLEEDDIEKSEMHLRQLVVTEKTPFFGKNLLQSGIRENYNCLVVGVERLDGDLVKPDVMTPFAIGDIVWIVGEMDDLYRIIEGHEPRPSNTPVSM